MRHSFVADGIWVFVLESARTVTAVVTRECSNKNRLRQRQ